MDRMDSNITPDAEALSLVPEAIARTLRLVPISAGSRTLKLAVAAPLSGDHLRSLTAITGRQLICQVEPGPQVVDGLLETVYGGEPRADSDSASAA